MPSIFFSQFFPPISYLIVESVVLERYRNFVRWTWRVHLAFIVAACAGVLLNMFDPDSTIIPYFILLGCTVVVNLIMLVRSSHDRNRRTFIMLGGLAVLGLFGFAEIVFFLHDTFARTVYTTTYVLQWGLLAFMVSLVSIVVLQTIEDNRKRRVAEERMLEALRRERDARDRFAQQLLQSQDNERKAIAMELHDAVGQELLIVKNMAALGLKNTDPADERQNTIADFLREISAAASTVLEIIRGLSRSLHPYQLDAMGLTVSLESIIARVREGPQTAFECSIDNVDRLFTKETELHLFRILQECVNNIIKHSGAARAVVRLVRSVDAVTLIVSDNGCGFPMAETAGFGLSGIRERAAIIGGSLDIRSGNEQGTVITIRIPL